jgi:hypothetical protein
VDALCDWACSRSYCPSSVCISETDSDDTCQWDNQAAESWDNSGAASLVDNYLQAYDTGMKTPDTLDHY